MLCMKCGRELETEQAFCDDCLAEMEKYPVKPGTVVQLPPQRQEPVVKKQTNHRRHPAVPLEDQVKRLKRRVAALSCALVLALAAAAGLGYLAAKEYIDYHTGFLPGQNYSSMTPAETTDTN